MERVFEVGCSGRGWQGKVLKGALKGVNFCRGCLNVGTIFAWGVEGGGILVSNSNGL